MATIDLTRRLRDVETRFESIEASLGDPAVVNDPDELRKQSKLHRELGRVVARYRELKEVDDRTAQARALLADPDADMADMAKAELEELQTRHEKLMADLQLLLLPKDPLDDKNTIIEIRAGTGGDEAALFAYDMFRLYTHYAERRG